MSWRGASFQVHPQIFCSLAPWHAGINIIMVLRMYQIATSQKTCRLYNYVLNLSFDPCIVTCKYTYIYNSDHLT